MKPGYKQTELGVIPEEWVVARLAAVCVMKSGEGITSANINQFSKYPCYGGNGLRGFTSRFTHNGDYALIGRQGALCGNVLGVDGTFFASEHAIVTTAFPQTDIRWLTYVLGEMRLNRYSESSAQPGLSVAKLLNLDLAVPPTKDEQRAIAGALRDVDVLIGALDQLIAKKRDLKQASMQQLLTGKKRLPGFQGKWDVKRLGDVASFSKGTQLHSSEADEGGKFAHLNGGITPSSYTHKSNTAANTIAISEGGNSCGFVQFMTEPYWCGGHCYSVIPNDIDNQFLYHAIKGQQSAIMALRVGSGLPNVQKTGLLVFKIRLPADLPEQTAIAEVLSDMDAELAALTQRRDKTRALKQGMMQELLTGRTRLV